jgi:hypothetical protein
MLPAVAIIIGRLRRSAIDEATPVSAGTTEAGAVEAEHAVEEKLQLVGRARRPGRRPPAGDDGLPADKAEGDVGVADVEGQKHGAMIARSRARPL